MKKLIIAVLLFCAPAWAGDDKYVAQPDSVTTNEVISAVKKIPDLEKRIEALEKLVNDLPRLTLPDDIHSWTLVPN